MAVTGNTHTWTMSCKPSGLPSMPSDNPIVLVAPECENIEINVLAGQNIEVFSGLVTVAQVTSFILHSSQGGVNVNTNSINGAGGQTIALGAAKAQGWNTAMTGVSNPLTIDITQIWVDNSAGAKDTIFRASFLTTV